MEVLLSKVTQQAMNYAIRSGVAITTTYALGQVSQWLKRAPRNLRPRIRDDLLRLKIRLETKMKIISPAIDMIELIAARGNTSLESAVALTTSIRKDMGALARQVSELMDFGAHTPSGDTRAKSAVEIEADADRIKRDIEALLSRIEDAVPLINLAITTSGVKLSTSLPSTVSPSRLLQASTFLTAGDSQYVANPGHPVQVGPTFMLTMFMLFGAHGHRPHDAESIREMTWKEVMHKACVKLMRVPLDLLVSPQENHDPLPSDSPAFEFAYRLVVVEDLDDDRMHNLSDDDEEELTPFEGVKLAGLRDYIPIHQISKIFYADTGKILNIGSDAATNQPVLLLKRDVNAQLPRQLIERETHPDDWALYWDDDAPQDPTSPTSPERSLHLTKELGYDENDDYFDPNAQLLREASVVPEKQPPMTTSKKWSLPADLDPEWVAFEVYVPNDDDSDDDEEDSTVHNSNSTNSIGHGIPHLPPPNFKGFEDPTHSLSKFSNLSLNVPSPPSELTSPQDGFSSLTNSQPEQSISINDYDGRQLSALPPLKTSLSLLELLLRLTSLQQFTQSSHLSTPDELLNFFLSESSTVGAGSDGNLRQRVRRVARQKVGFDPYDESPVKFRTEHDIQNADHGSVYSDGPAGGFESGISPRASPVSNQPLGPGSAGGGSRRLPAYIQSPLGTGWSPQYTPPPQPRQSDRQNQHGSRIPMFQSFSPSEVPRSPLRPSSPTDSAASIKQSRVSPNQTFRSSRPHDPNATTISNLAVPDSARFIKSDTPIVDSNRSGHGGAPVTPAKTTISTADATHLSPSYPLPSIEDG